MNLLFVDEKSWMKKVAYTPHYLAECLVRRGHKVYVIDFDDTWNRNRMFDFISRRSVIMKGKLDFKAQVEIHSPAFLKFPAISRLSTLLTHTLEIMNIIKQKQIDAVISYSLTNALGTILCCKYFKAPLIFHTIDMLGPLVPYKILRFPALYLERMLFKHAKIIFALTPLLGERAMSLGAKRVEIITNGVDTKKIRPGVNVSHLRKGLKLRDEKVILFLGTFNEHSGMKEFLAEFCKIAQDGIKLVVVGDDIVSGGKELEKIKVEAEELNIEQYIIFTGMQPVERAPEFISLADVCISTYYPSEFSKYNVTMKIFEYMAGGKPSVCFELPGTRSVVGEGKGVFYVKSFSEMCDVIMSLLKDPDRRQLAGTRARHFIEDFTWEKIALKAEEIMKSVL